MQNKLLKCSFDFDQTLDRPIVQQYARELINRGIDVWVCTARFSDKRAPSPDWNKDLYEVTDSLGIPRNKIIFVEMADKYKFLENQGFIWHLDDDWVELNMLNKFTNVKGISSFGNPKWKFKCDKLLK